MVEKILVLEPKNLPFTHLAAGWLVSFPGNPFIHRKVRIILNLLRCCEDEEKECFQRMFIECLSCPGAFVFLISLVLREVH